MAGVHNKRVPLSCEPCRERKIKCYRASTGFGRTCDTCVRRGVPLEECVFLRDLPRSQRSKGDPRRPTRPSIAANHLQTPASRHDLFARIEKLESLLSASGRLIEDESFTTPTPSHGQHISTSAPLSATAPRSHQDTNAQQTPPSRVAGHQKLRKTTSGHEKYEPLPSIFSSHHAEDTATALDTQGPSRQFPFTMASSSLNELLSPLPSLRHCDALVGLYDRVFGSLFHVLHWPTFAQGYSSFRANPQRVSLSWLALLYAVLGVAVTALDETDDVLLDLGKHANPLENLMHLTSTYRAAAMRCLDADQYLWQHNLHTLQTLILLIYGISHSHGSSWALLGTAKNIALSLGCHVDPDEFGLDIVEAEERRRCWFALSMLYHVQNVTLGSIDSSPLAHSVNAPLDANDDELGRAVRSRGATQMTYILFKFRLYELFARISGMVGDNGALPRYDDIANLDAEIAVQQDLWSSRYLADTRDISLPDYHTAHLQILSGYSHQLSLLLHKPIITQQQGVETSSWGRYTPIQISRSRRRCIDSARALLDIHAFLYDSPEMRPYQWYNRGLGSFHAFHAVATIAFISETSKEMTAHERMELEQEVNNAAMVFQSISDSGMSVICRKAVPVVQQFQKRIKSVNQAQHQPAPLIPAHTRSIDIGLVSPASQGIDQSGSLHLGQEDYPVDMDAMAAGLQASQWLSPSMVTWDAWDQLVGGAGVL